VAGDFVEALVDIMRLGDMFPLPEGYAERAELAEQFRRLSAYHFDPYSIALTKLARSEARDVDDVDSMLKSDLIDCAALRRHSESVLQRLQHSANRSDREDFRRKVDAFYREHCADHM